MIIIRGTNMYPGQIESVLMKHAEVGGNWRMVLTTENEVDMLTVEVETKHQLSKDHEKELTKQIQSDIKSVIVLNPRVDILPPNTIPESGLKAKRVIDHRKGDTI